MNERCLSVVMPAYNEEATIGTVTERVLASPFVAELVVIDDGSRDRTVEIVRAIDDARIRLVRQPINLGKGAALRRGFEEATAPFVIVQDADLEYDPAEYAEVLAPLLSGVADVVYGSRFLSGRPHRVLYFWHSVGNKLLTTVSNMFTNLNLTDMETCYKAFRREVLQTIDFEEDRFGVEPEITAKVAAGGWRIFEVGISYSGRTYAEGKKIGWRDGVRAIYGIVRYSRAWRSVRTGLDTRRGRITLDETPPEPDDVLVDALRAADTGEQRSLWLAAELAPHLGREVLEVGAGNGALTAFLAEGRLVTATDPSKRCVEALEERFAGVANVDVRPLDAVGFDGRRFDTIVVHDVLERVDDDGAALRDLVALLNPGGRLCVLVPAFPGLTSSLDRRAGRRRRYRRAGLAVAFDRAGLAVLDARYLDAAGAVAWWVFARQLGRVPAPGSAARVYDRVVVPRVRRLEGGRHPRFGQTLLCVGEPRETPGAPATTSSTSGAYVSS